MGCNEYRSQVECVRIGCQWKETSCQSVQILKSPMAKSAPERENENESETESEVESGLVSSSPETTCVGLLETNCQFSPFCKWSAIGCVQVSGGGKNEYEMETESEMEYGNLHTFDSNYVGPQPIQPVQPIQPMQPMQPIQPVPVPFRPSTPASQFPCLEILHQNECDMQSACAWDSRQICLPSSFIKPPEAHTPVQCSTVPTLLECVQRDCEWNIHSQSCMPDVVLRATRSCEAEGENECAEYFGCEWNVDLHECIRKAVHTPDAHADQPEAAETTAAVEEVVETTEEADFDEESEPEYTEPVESYTEYEEYTPSGSYPQTIDKSEAPTTSLQSSYSCLTHVSQAVCQRDMQCFWDHRQICLPLVLASEPTTSAPAPTGIPINMPVSTEGETESENEGESESESQNGNPSPQTGFVPGQGYTGQGQSQSGLVAGEGPVNVCFYYADKTRCLNDIQCFWDQRTALCASLDKPNYLPQDCEGFFYEEPCQKDTRCVWKSGECEELNLDCEDMTTKTRCISAKYNGVPCIWSEHEQECDEAPILLRKSRTDMSQDNPSKTSYLWISAVLAVLGSILLFVIILRANAKPKEVSDYELFNGCDGEGNVIV